MIVFNGEIYNHHLVRKEINGLKDLEWKSTSDTETLLESIELWGLQATLERLIGMFVFALFDKEESLLVLARDRFGEKPLYYGNCGDSFVFSSELKAIKRHSKFNNQINRDVLGLYLQYSSIPHPYSIYEKIWKLEPATFIVVDLGGSILKKSTYWNVLDIVKKNQTIFQSIDYLDATNKLEDILTSAISLQMVADVNLGAYLSGGVDSSTVVSLMQKVSDRPIKTFTIGFSDSKYNEAHYAKQVAMHLKTDHHEMYITERDALECIPSLPNIYDEPFSDSSQIPTYLVSKMAKKEVTVVLSGDAGDELFAGYSRYGLTEKLWTKLSVLPIAVRKIIAKGIQNLSVEKWDYVANFFGVEHSNAGYKLHRGAGVITSKNETELYYGLISRINNPYHWLSKDYKYNVLPTLIDSVEILACSDSAIERMMVTDLLSYLPWDILTKTDRASMAVSLESRVPMLDHRVVEFAWSLPLEYKLRNGIGKSILRDVLYRHVPKELINRPKMGFAIPLAEWLRGPLREWAEELLNTNRLINEGFFDSNVVETYWKDHISGRRNWEHQLWSVLMFQAWLDNERNGDN